MFDFIDQALAQVKKAWSRVKALTDKIPDSTIFWILFLVGANLRLKQYLANRSFWLDEAFLAINIRDKSYFELLEPLDYSQVAPIGFLWVQKLIIEIFGSSELVFRALPFLAGLGSIILAYKLIKLISTNTLATITVFFIILSTGYTYYSSELKQYSTDIFLCLLLFYLYFLKINEDDSFTWKKTILIGLIGGACIWFSNSTLIVLTSIGLYSTFQSLYLKNYNRLLQLLPAFSIWGLSFIAYYFLFIHEHPTTAIMVRYWQNYFLPLESVSGGFSWLKERMIETANKQMGFYRSEELVVYSSLIGVALIAIFRQWKLLILLVPISIHLLLSAFQLYPFGERTSLYFTPFIFLFFASAFYFITIPTKNPVYMLLLIPLLYYPNERYIKTASSWYNSPRMKDHIKPTLLHIRENKQPNDKIYVYNGNIAPYLYYEKEFHLQSNPKIIGEHPRDVKKVVAQFNELEGRVWFVFSHLSYRPVVDSLFSKIEKIGPLDRYESPGCYTFLVDFNKSKSNE